MQVVYARCAGLDVHKKTVSACITMCGGKHGKRNRRGRSERSRARLTEAVGFFLTRPPAESRLGSFDSAFLLAETGL